MKTKTRQTMDRLIFKTGFLLLSAVFLATTELAADVVTKNYHKEFRAGASTTLDINNKYGDVVVETTDGDQIVIDVIVSVEFPGSEQARRLLSYIDVQFSESDDVVSAVTVIDNKFSFSGWGTRSRRFSIDYNIKMPAGINFNLVNRYGNSELEEINGLVKLDIRYGNLKAEKLTRGNENPLNQIVLSYGNAEISNAEWLGVELRYSGRFSIDKGQALLLDSKYSKIQINDISSLVGETKYDNIRIERINNLAIDAGYTTVNVGELLKKLRFDASYGSITIDRIRKDFQSIDSKTKYMGVRFGIDPEASYRLQANLSYGDLRYDRDNLRHDKKIVQNNSTEISGIVGNEESPSATVTIRSSYGSVKLD